MNENENKQDAQGVCPGCGTTGLVGRFCTSCGARVTPGFCPECGEATAPGSRFCAACGATLGASVSAEGALPAGAPDVAIRSSRSGGGHLRDAHRAGFGPEATPARNNALWIVSILGVVGVLLFATADIWSGPNSDAGITPPTGGLGPAPQVDLANMTPRAAADRLFERVVRAAERGDSVEVQSFIPMALSAHELARPMDSDGEFHLTVLQRIANMNQEAMAVVDSVLVNDPDHLLLLTSGAEAARAAGDTVKATQYYEHLLEIYDVESASGRAEYLDHSPLFPEMPVRAREFLGIGPGGLPDTAGVSGGPGGKP